MKLKTLLRFLFGLLLLSILAFFLINKYYLNKADRNIQEEKVLFVMSASDLFNSFFSDSKSANDIFLDKTGLVSGKISSVEKANNQKVISMVFRKGIFGDEGVRCVMNDNSDNETEKFEIGTYVVLKGVCMGYNQTDVILTKCSVINNN